VCVYDIGGFGIAGCDVVYVVGVGVVGCIDVGSDAVVGGAGCGVDVVGGVVVGCTTDVVADIGGIGGVTVVCSCVGISVFCFV